jgi:hypothetical protein
VKLFRVGYNLGKITLIYNADIQTDSSELSSSFAGPHSAVSCSLSCSLSGLLERTYLLITSCTSRESRNLSLEFPTSPWGCTWSCLISDMQRKRGAFVSVAHLNLSVLLSLELAQTFPFSLQLALLSEGSRGFPPFPKGRNGQLALPERE